MVFMLFLTTLREFGWYEFIHRAPLMAVSVDAFPWRKHNSQHNLSKLWKCLTKKQ